MDLRELLFEAADTGDLERVEALCREHREAIVEQFASWQTIPEAVRGDSAALQRYANGLITVARTFADLLDDETLLQQLAGDPDDNPMTRWDAELQAAIGEMEELEFDQAGRRLQKLLEESSTLRGTGPDQLRPVTVAYIGECLFQQGNADAAISFMKEAFELVRKLGDSNAMAAYLDSLYEMNRYLGRGAEAASYAAQLATLFAMAGREADATMLQQRAAIARAGEPRNRVVATLEDGATLELDQVASFAGRIRFSFQRDRVSLRKANALVERGEQAGAEGRYEDALVLFRAASELDPHFPHARYQEGFTLLLLKRYADAVAALEATEVLAPGWFHCRADLWLARELAAGRIDHATFEAVRELEDGALPAAEKLALADRMIAKAPQVAALYLERGRQLSRLGRAEEARTALRDGLSRDPDPDVRTRLLVQLGVTTEDKAERAKLFEEAVAIDGNLVAAATARLALRQG
ncbi:MAG: tetratricopeptide repeat protein [Deltaproteobacteria bacterium]|nr:tetratricopeptide repeat protein [Deltaproteobacteria bacterium]MDQ3299051.1 tetratricopeptide repeat protein [Myxococcota bacterium]